MLFIIETSPYVSIKESKDKFFLYINFRQVPRQMEVKGKAEDINISLLYLHSIWQNVWQQNIHSPKFAILCHRLVRTSIKFAYMHV